MTQDCSKWEGRQSEIVDGEAELWMDLMSDLGQMKYLEASCKNNNDLLNLATACLQIQQH